MTRSPETPVTEGTVASIPDSPDLSAVRWLIDGYLVWAEGEGIPIVEDVAIDLPNVATAPWPRMGVDGAFVHAHSRGDYCSIYLLDLPPGTTTNRVHHLYEAIYFVLDGQGSTVVEGPGGDKRSFEWGKGSLFCLPLNAPYRIYNSSGQNRARIAVCTNLPMVMKQFRERGLRVRFDRAVS